IGEGAYDSPAGGVTTVEAPVPSAEVWVGWSLPAAVGAGVSMHVLLRRMVANLGAGVDVELVSQRLGSALICHRTAGTHPSARANQLVHDVSRMWLELTVDGDYDWFERLRAETATEMALALENLGARALAEAELLEAEPQGFPGDLLARLGRTSVVEARAF